MQMKFCLKYALKHREPGSEDAQAGGSAGNCREDWHEGKRGRITKQDPYMT